MADTTKDTPAEKQAAPAPLTEFFFPTAGVTIAAASREEAEQKLAEQLNNNH